MLSAMTTSENFSLSSRSRCQSSPYRSVARSAFGSSRRDECREFLLDGSLTSVFDKPRDGFESDFPLRDREGNGLGERENVQNDNVTPSVVCDAISVSEDESEDGSKIEFEADISELLEQLDLEDISFDHLKPLKIDPHILKLNFSNLATNSGVTNYRSLDESCGDVSRERKRASHHLSGGGLISDLSRDGSSTFKNSDTGSKSRCWTLSDGFGSAENVFNFDDPSYFNPEEESKSSNFLNQISPSSPLTFDLAVQPETNDITKGSQSNAESTNPFNNFLKDVLEEDNTFSSTNPFTGVNFLSSLDQLTNSSPDYENLSVPQRSFSQCSTRPASPITREESCVSNPFRLNQASPQSCPSMNVSPFLVNDGHYPSSQSTLSNPPSSFIFAVPVFPIFQHQIANSSTQTNEPSDESRNIQEPIYQNVTNQLRKIMQQNSHSEYDLQCLKTTTKDLKNSGWYYENVSWQESVVLLKNTQPGTFLIRDSSDPNFLFSLSVQTSRGPTSVRLHYVNGQFRLDAEEKLIPHMPSFNSVIELIDYYIENTMKNKFTNAHFRKTSKNGKDKLQKSKEQVWIDSQGNVYSNILLVKPLYKKEHFSTLQHLTRLAINRHLKKNGIRSKLNFRVTPVYESSPFQDSSFPASSDTFSPLNVDDLPLPATVINYLKDYPYCH